ncbi:MAG: DUF2213 domain-containing protein [Lachnospiraceae bacterium]
MMEPKLRKVRRLDTIRLDKDDRTYFTDEGYLVDHPILTSCGIFEYTNPDGSIRRELRLPEHVFNEKSLATYKGKPIIITHEAGIVSKDNVDREQIGTILTNGYQDGEDVRAEIIIHNTDAMKDSGLKELSLGYNLDLVEEPGTYNGEPYDAIQTNIVINHLALVASARAGEQARLNIDGSDEPELKGGKLMANETKSRADGGAMSAEELKKAIEAYKERKAGRAAAGSEEPPAADEAGAAAAEESTTEPATEEEKAADGEGCEEPAPEEGSSPADIAQMVKDRRDRRDAEEDPKDVEGAMGVIAQQDEDIDMLLACLEKVMADAAVDSADNADGGTDAADQADNADQADGSDDKSGSLNADSVDEIFRQRLSICRIGDKLHIDGMENKSILEGKKAIIAKVLPGMRLDGKSNAYVDAAYDMAVNEVNKRKDVSFQKKQMTGKTAPATRTDGNPAGKSGAAQARQRMIDREGGK